MRYRVLTRSEESATERRLADLACTVAARELEISRPQVKFIAETWRDGDASFSEAITGFQRGRVVYIVAGLEPQEILKTAIHETAHVAQRDLTQLIERERRAAWLERVLSLQFCSRDAAGLIAELQRFLAPLKITPTVRTRETQRTEKQLRRPMSVHERQESDRLRRQYAPLLAKRNQLFVGEKTAAKIPAGFELSTPCGDLRVYGK